MKSKRSQCLCSWGVMHERQTLSFNQTSSQSGCITHPPSPPRESLEQDHGGFPVGIRSPLYISPLLVAVDAPSWPPRVSALAMTALIAPFGDGAVGATLHASSVISWYHSCSAREQLTCQDEAA